jgi:predicted DNA-binding transcriptional regulator AlpA
MPTKAPPQFGSSSALPEVGFVRLPQILSVLPIGKSTWWAGVRSGRFPPPTKLGSRISVWEAQAIRGLLTSLADDGKA